MWCKLCSLLRSSVSAIMLCSPSSTTTPTNAWSSRHSRMHGTSRYSGMSRNTRFYGTYGTYGTNGTSWSPGTPRNGRTSSAVSSCLPALDDNYPTRWRNATSVSNSDHAVSCSMSASWLLLSTSSSASSYACSTTGDASSTSGSATTTLS